jgi:long-subunit fatty acid transport protein
MKLRTWTFGVCLLATGTAFAGGLFLPGSGAISTSRAGAAVSSVDDGEALSINPAGLAKAEREWTITVSAAIIRYYMEFSRRGTYDAVLETPADPYAGQAYETIENDPKPPTGIGSFQPIPVVAVVANLDKLGWVPGLSVAAGLYAPNGYPFRDMTGGYNFIRDTQTNTDAPPPTRYDVMTAESQALFPSIAAAYRILPSLDVGARFSAGRVKSKSTVIIQGTPGNVNESVRHDTQFTADVADNFVPTFGIGLAFRPTPVLELGAVYNYSATLRTRGTGQSVKGPNVDPDRVIGPIPDDQSRCETGGSFEKQKACITTQLPMNAAVAGRYKFLDRNGAMKGDIELQVGWENWGKTCDFASASAIADPDARLAAIKKLGDDCASPSQILVKLDTGLYNTSGEFAQPVEVNYVNLGLQDVYNVRLGGSYHIPLRGDPLDPMSGGKKIILRGGVGYDTQAARDHWLRASFDGASRITTTVGGTYQTRRFAINAGFGYIYEGSNTNSGAGADGQDCNPTSNDLNACGGGSPRPLEDRNGPDPTSPLLTPDLQFENPFNQGTIKSSYVLFMLGFSTWF